MASLSKEVRRKVGKAIHDHGLLGHGDRIMVALSGGEDSSLMVYMLQEWRKKAPIYYDMIAVYLDMGFGSEAPEKLIPFVRSLGIGVHLEETDFGTISHTSFNRDKSPCFLCSHLRRKRLFELADSLGCNKIALGHNMDDLIETFFINVCNAGEMSTMMPRQEMFGGKLTLIRPLALVPKDKIGRYVNRLGLPKVENPCPSASKSSRKEIRTLLEAFYKINPKARSNIFRALSHIRAEYLLDQRLRP